MLSVAFDWKARKWRKGEIFARKIFIFHRKPRLLVFKAKSDVVIRAFHSLPSTDSPSPFSIVNKFRRSFAQRWSVDSKSRNWQSRARRLKSSRLAEFDFKLMTFNHSSKALNPSFVFFRLFSLTLDCWLDCDMDKLFVVCLIYWLCPLCSVIYTHFTCSHPKKRDFNTFTVWAVCESFRS